MTADRVPRDPAGAFPEADTRKHAMSMIAISTLAIGLALAGTVLCPDPEA